MIINPKKLTIEANASCQLRCPTCPTTSRGYPPVVGNGYLKFRDLKNLLDTNPQIQEVCLENRGEMFLNPDLLPIIEFCFKKNIQIYCDGGVNLNHVQEKILEGLVKYRFRRLLCSIDGASPETYRIYRVGGDFDRVIDNIRTINRYKKLYGSKYPALTWQFVVFGHNEHEIPRAKKIAKDLDMDFAFKMSWDSGYSPIRDEKFVIAETGWQAVTRERFAEVTGDDYQRRTCYSLWQSPRVNWDGKILGCCWNSWGEFGGNAFNDGYILSINNEKIKHAREVLVGKVEPSIDLPCRTCDLYFKMRDSNNYLTLNEIFHSLYEHRLLYSFARLLYRASGLRRLRAWIKKRSHY